MSEDRKDRDKKNREYYASLSMREKSIYNKVETVIIDWVNDGHRTAGSLTREIIKSLKE
jgi:hypothetical protein